MMENRSFDHMLGYLSLPAARGGAGRTDVDGLTGSESNDHGGARFPVNALANTALRLDPHHDWKAVKEQIETLGPDGRPMGGFAASYGTVSGMTNARIGDVMGYYTGTALPTYDFLARHYCVCDRWFSSFPGATIPNRLFSLAGTARRVSPNILAPFTLPSVFEVLDQQDVSWEIYFEDAISSLQLFSGHGQRHDDHFHGLNFLLKRPANKPLPAAAWIDPHFLSHKNDDHPPTDVARGQLLVRSIYEALRVRSEWPRTLLIVTYDEHGGFHDHVTPPGFAGQPPVPDDSPDPNLPGGYNPFRRLGPRVPALLVSPRIRQPVCKETLDHTTIVRTLIEQFCPNVPLALSEMPKRVRDFAKPIPASLFDASGPEVAAGPEGGAGPGPARAPGPRAAAARRARPSAALLSALDEKLAARLRVIGRKPSPGTTQATALQRELRPLLNRLLRRGVVKARQLPASWKKR
jgi:phospholipase C